MKRSPRPLKTAELPRSLHQQLNSYALAASAASGSACFGAASRGKDYLHEGASPDSAEYPLQPPL
jgi:hypothetical protein